MIDKRGNVIIRQDNLNCYSWKLLLKRTSIARCYKVPVPPITRGLQGFKFCKGPPPTIWVTYFVHDKKINQISVSTVTTRGMLQISPTPSSSQFVQQEPSCAAAELFSLLPEDIKISTLNSSRSSRPAGTWGEP